MDTPGNRRGDFLDLMREVRWELDRNGFEHVKIFASGGIDVEYILHLNPICDAYGVGGAIADAPMIDYSLDIVEVNGEDRSKRGKRGGRKRLLELEDGRREVLPETAPAPEGATRRPAPPAGPVRHPARYPAPCVSACWTSSAPATSSSEVPPRRVDQIG